MEIVRKIANTILYSLSKSTNNQVQFILEIDEDVPQYIKVDKTILTQIMLNLVTNSIKFTQSGTIRLKLSKQIENNDQIITFSLIDTGKGISEEMRKNLFKKYSKEEKMNNDSGCGLGLALVDLLCLKLGSKIMHRDNFPSGSIFFFSFKEEAVFSCRYLRENKETLTNLNKTFLEKNLNHNKYNLLKMDNISLSIPNKYAREITSIYNEFTLTNDINEFSNCKKFNNN